MGPVENLLDRPTYGMAQVDRLLALSPGTARRWIDGYTRGGRTYPPVVRVEATGEEIVTWGEFVETRFLASFRGAGVPIVLMRPAIERLRESFHPRYPLAFARPFAEGKELVYRVQEDVKLNPGLRLVVVRNGQTMLTPSAQSFVRSVDFGENEQEVVRLRPVSEIQDVFIDPVRQFGEPAVRSVPTEVIAEQVRAGEDIDSICELYELSRRQVEAAVRYELITGRKAA